MGWQFNPFTGNLDQVGSGAAGVSLSDPNTWTARQTFNAGVTLGGNISAASWGLNGLKLIGSGSTLTDTSAAGTVASGATDVLGGNTIAASNVRTLTDYYSLYIKNPIAGANVTLTNKWSLGLEGGLKVGTTINTPQIDFGSVGALSIFSEGGGYVMTFSNLTRIASFTTNPRRFSLGYDVALGWAPSGQIPSATGDLFLYRDAPNTFAQRNSTNANVFKVANTWTDASNYEYGTFGWSANVLCIGSTQGGTGSRRSVAIGTNVLGSTTGQSEILYLQGGSVRIYTAASGSQSWTFDTTGNLVTGADNTYDIGASGGTRPRNIYVGTNFVVPGGATAVLKSAAAITSGAGAQTGTLTNAPAAGNPTSWIPINDNGTTRYIPAW